VTPGWPETCTVVRPGNSFSALAGGSLPFRPATAVLPALLESSRALTCFVPAEASVEQLTPRQLQKATYL
jgi:hypothetical protein